MKFEKNEGRFVSISTCFIATFIVMSCKFSHGSLSPTVAVLTEMWNRTAQKDLLYSRLEGKWRGKCLAGLDCLVIGHV